MKTNHRGDSRPHPGTLPGWVEDITLEREQHEASIAIDNRERARLTETARFERYEDEAKRQLIHSLHASVYGRTLEAKVIEYPRNWIEALKERFAPEWLLRRCPVDYVRIKVTAKNIFPHLRPIPGEQENFIRIYVADFDKAPLQP